VSRELRGDNCRLFDVNWSQLAAIAWPCTGYIVSSNQRQLYIPASTGSNSNWHSTRFSSVSGCWQYNAKRGFHHKQRRQRKPRAQPRTNAATVFYILAFRLLRALRALRWVEIALYADSLLAMNDGTRWFIWSDLRTTWVLNPASVLYHVQTKKNCQHSLAASDACAWKVFFETYQNRIPYCFLSSPESVPHVTIVSRNHLQYAQLSHILRHFTEHNV